MMKLIALLLLCTVLSGCASSFVVPRPATTRLAGHIGQKIRVANPELEREFHILIAAGIYNISTDPEAASLTLEPIQSTRFGCANPLLGSAITLGILPASLPAGISFRYSIGHFEKLTALQSIN